MEWSEFEGRPTQKYGILVLFLLIALFAIGITINRYQTRQSTTSMDQQPFDFPIPVEMTTTTAKTRRT